DHDPPDRHNISRTRSGVRRSFGMLCRRMRLPAVASRAVFGVPGPAIWLYAVSNDQGTCHDAGAETPGSASVHVHVANPARPRGIPKPSTIRSITSYAMTLRPWMMADTSGCDWPVNAAIRCCE